jgi:hypothetical protein
LIYPKPQNMAEEQFPAMLRFDQRSKLDAARDCPAS